MAKELPELAKIWNDNRGPLHEVKGCGPTRLKMAHARWIEVPDKEYWKQVMIRIRDSDFCMGKVNGWTANFDFFVRGDTHHKVMEGKYDNKNRTSSPINWDKVFS